MTTEHITPELAMQRAFALATSVLSTSPNPRVGCVIVRDGVIVGEGFHTKAGEPHAEANALRQAGEMARGATAYVTLEPCSHTGRTPPCCDALIRAGVAEVIFAGADPNPRVAGQGVQRMQAAGIRVQGPTQPELADEVNRGFIKRMKTGLPWVRCKLGMSLDGRTAMASGESKWITSAGARADVQRLRAISCAVLTGVNTVLADNPSLRVRPEQLAQTGLTVADVRQPLRVILDSELRTPVNAAVLGEPGQALLMTSAAAAEARAEAFAATQTQVEAVSSSAEGRLDLEAVLRSLVSNHECNEVLVEAGPILSGAMMQAGLIDELVVYMAPSLLGSDARPLMQLPGLTSISDKVMLEFTEISRIGSDCRLTARVQPKVPAQN